MKKTITFLIALLVMITIIQSTAVSEEVDSSSYFIEINEENGKITIKETISIKGETNETVSFWIQNGATEYRMEKITGTELTEIISQNSNIHSYNISSPNITKDTQITVTLTYKLPQQTEDFQKRLLFNNTEQISVKWNDEKIYTAKDLGNNSYFDLTLYNVAETPLTWYIIGFIVLLIILLGVTTVYSFKKQKLTKKKDMSSGSEEFLSTKKTLLMELLKDLEKQHRAEKISDDTYNKIKEQYKQEAVDTMKKQENFKSEVK
jgi:hypothetical protein